jgi:hypothetical protein
MVGLERQFALVIIHHANARDRNILTQQEAFRRQALLGPDAFGDIEFHWRSVLSKKPPGGGFDREVGSPEGVPNYCRGGALILRFITFDISQNNCF